MRTLPKKGEGYVKAKKELKKTDDRTVSNISKKNSNRICKELFKGPIFSTINKEKESLQS